MAKCKLCNTEMEHLEGVGDVCVTEHCPTLDGVPTPGSTEPVALQRREDSSERE